MYRNTRGAGFGVEVKRRIMLGMYVLSARYYDTVLQESAASPHPDRARLHRNIQRTGRHPCARFTVSGF